MDFQELWKMVNELAKKHFYGTLEIEFKNGKPYLGVKKEKVLFDRPMVQSFSPSSVKLAEAKK
jgi:uncharacterized protein YueI